MNNSAIMSLNKNICSPCSEVTIIGFDIAGHLYLPPIQNGAYEILGYTAKWDLASANEYHRSMAKGNHMEQDAAIRLSVTDVYQAMHAFLSTEGQYAEEDVMGAYILDQRMYEKLRHYLHGDMSYKEEIA